MATSPGQVCDALAATGEPVACHVEEGLHQPRRPDRLEVFRDTTAPPGGDESSESAELEKSGDRA
jgi:hypothetical protein